MATTNNQTDLGKDDGDLEGEPSDRVDQDIPEIDEEIREGIRAKIHKIGPQTADSLTEKEPKSPSELQLGSPAYDLYLSYHHRAAPGAEMIMSRALVDLKKYGSIY